MADQYKLPVGETLRAAWAKTSGSKTVILTGIVVSTLISLAFAMLLSLTNTIPAINVPLNLIAAIIQYLLEAGLLYMGMRWVYQTPITLQNLFKGFEKQTALRLIGLYLLQVLILLPFILCFVIGGGLAALSKQPAYQQMTFLVPVAIIINILALIGIIWIALRMLLAPAYVLDQQSHPWLAIKQSFCATKGNTLRLGAILLAVVIIIIISAIPLGIGLIWTLPFSLVTYGILYQYLKIATRPS